MSDVTMFEVELYAFEGASGSFRLTPHEFDVQIGGHLYKHTPIERSSIALGAEATKAALEIKLPPDHALVRHLLKTAITGESIAVRLLIARRSGDGETWTISGARWIGRVLGVEVDDDAARIRCESAYVSLKRIGLRRLYSRACSHVLYSEACGAAPLFGTARVVWDVKNRPYVPFYVVPDSVRGKLSGGWLETLSGSRHMILEEKRYTYEGVKLLYPITLASGTEVKLFAGCDHSMATCANRFGNLANFGGFPFIPQKNPFSTGVF